jgi:hypothetical protein
VKQGDDHNFIPKSSHPNVKAKMTDNTLQSIANGDLEVEGLNHVAARDELSISEASHPQRGKKADPADQSTSLTNGFKTT